MPEKALLPLRGSGQVGQETREDDKYGSLSGQDNGGRRLRAQEKKLQTQGAGRTATQGAHPDGAGNECPARISGGKKAKLEETRDYAAHRAKHERQNLAACPGKNVGSQCNCYGLASQAGREEVCNQVPAGD